MKVVEVQKTSKVAVLYSLNLHLLLGADELVGGGLQGSQYTIHCFYIFYADEVESYIGHRDTAVAVHYSLLLHLLRRKCLPSSHQGNMGRSTLFIASTSSTEENI